jgi:hypothetical protein
MKKTPVSRRLVLAAAGAGVVIALSSGAAYAVSSAVANSNAVIHGCLSKAARNGTRVLVIRQASHSCPKGTTALSWNQRGPAGPATAGPQGLDVTEVTVTTHTGNATATCPTSHPYVTGGGGQTVGGRLVSSEPVVQAGHPGAWAVTAQGPPAPSEMIAYALCAK